MFYERFVGLCRTKNIAPSAAAIEMGFSKSTVSAWKKNSTTPDREILAKIARYFNVSIDYLVGKTDLKKPKGVKIPVLGCVPAGIPIEAIEDIIDYEEITQEMATTGEFFALKIKGDSMEPRICDGDVVIVRRQPDVDSGQIAIVMVNGCNATCKRVMKYENGISLIPNNPAYEPRFYTNAEIQSLPITIIGKVEELRGKF